MGGIVESLVQFLHPHYVTNILLAVTFYMLKTIHPFCTVLFEDCHLEMREWELLTFLGCIIVMKNRKTPSYSMYLETACMFAKMLSSFLFFRQNPIYGALYVLVCLLHLVFLPEPVYKGPDYVTFFRGPNLEHELERDKRINWLIEFYAPWAPNCVGFTSAFAELSAQFTLDNLKFGKMDIGRYPDIAKKYQIDTSSWSRQLPTIILFQNGKETRRRPIIDSKGKVRLKFIFCKENVEKDFQLAELYSECKKYPLKSRSGAKKKEQDGGSYSGPASEQARPLAEEHFDEMADEEQESGKTQASGEGEKAGTVGKGDKKNN